MVCPCLGLGSGNPEFALLAGRMGLLGVLTLDNHVSSTMKTDWSEV